MISHRSRIFLLSLLMILPFSRIEAQAGTSDATRTTTPILIELFTSEGCSSCPPADAWLQRLDAAQPIPGAQAIVLSEHVDYWNHDGWKDPFSSPLLTERQNEYARSLGLSSPYTPQLIVNGKNELQLTDTEQVSKVLLHAAKASPVPITIAAISVGAASPSSLRALIVADGTAQKHSADIFAVLALDHAESQVLHGENGGRHLTHVAVAQDVVKIGRLEKGKTFTGDYQARLKPGQDPNKLRLVVFIQDSGPGEVLGAAEQKISTSGK
jgi:hypothetical protein